MTFIKNGWYCVAFGSEITEKPMMRRILDIPMFMVRDSEGEVRVMHDRCPHRFAPLHKGVRIDDTIECPYHGLRFDFTGTCVLNPHGSGRIPAAAKVASFPTVESRHFVWLWPGDPALANPSEVPDTQLFDIGELKPVSGHLTMPLDYRLVLDNLLDLSHAGYIHAGTLSPARKGSGAEVKREVDTEIGERSVMVRAKMGHVPTPTSQALYFEPELGDFHSWMEWLSPGTMRHSLSMTEPDAGFGNGAQARNAHLITPETATSTHYFWMHTRDTRKDDKEVDRKTREIIEYAFTQEDEPMVTACQEYMNGEEFFSLKPLFLDTDLAATRCRRIVERLIDEENSETAPSKSQEIQAA